MRAIILLSLLATAACSTYDQRVANTCSSLGAPPGSDHYWECANYQYAADNQQRRNGGALMMLGGGLMMMGR